jgi:light-regulated signal transduction histidine kinase (bacteriophytochrome)
MRQPRRDHVSAGGCGRASTATAQTRRTRRLGTRWPASQSDRLFAPFQRLGDREPRGLGLGLSVARGFTEAMGGTLMAEDTPGGGLTMVVSLPRSHPTPTPSVVEPTAAPAELAP